MEKKKEKTERYYMGKEDIKVVAATLAPPSSSSISPSFPSLAPTHMVIVGIGNVRKTCVREIFPKVTQLIADSDNYCAVKCAGCVLR